MNRFLRLLLAIASAVLTMLVGAFLYILTAKIGWFVTVFMLFLVAFFYKHIRLDEDDY